MIKTSELVNELQKLRVVDISDACDGNGLYHQVMNQNMRPLREGLFAVGSAEACVCGPAFTVKAEVEWSEEPPCKDWEEYQGKIDPPGQLERYQEMYSNIKGHVIVTDVGGAPLGFWGSDNSMAVTNRGAVGIIIDGGIRDSEEIKREGLKLWGTSRTCLHLWPRLKPIDDIRKAAGQIITCAGVTVRPGDIICADDDGVIVLPIEKAEAILIFAKRTLAKDQKTRRQNYIDAGIPFDSTLGPTE
jgi:4-hydroxy-4-methyl-2-oxoglutarate aldolase